MLFRALCVRRWPGFQNVYDDWANPDALSSLFSFTAIYSVGQARLLLVLEQAGMDDSSALLVPCMAKRGGLGSVHRLPPFWLFDGISFLSGFPWF